MQASSTREERTDRQLVEEVLCGSNATMGLLWKRHYPFVLRQLKTRSWSRNHGKDIASRVWKHLIERDYRALRSWRGQGPIRPYLWRITINEAYSYLRTIRQPVVLHEPPRPPRTDPVVRRQELDRFWSLVRARLSPRAYDALCRHARGETRQEIAAALKTNPNNVSVMLLRARGIALEAAMECRLFEETGWLSRPQQRRRAVRREEPPPPPAAPV